MALGTYRPRNTGRYPLVCASCGRAEAFPTLASATRDRGWEIDWKDVAGVLKIARCACKGCAASEAENAAKTTPER